MLNHLGFDVCFKLCGTAGDNQPGYYLAEVEYRGRLYEIGIYPDDLNIHCGKSLFEPYLRREYENDDVLLASFLERVRLLFSGREWSEWDSVLSTPRGRGEGCVGVAGKETCRVSSPDQMSSLSGLLRDRWLDLDGIRNDHLGTLQVPFDFPARDRVLSRFLWFEKLGFRVVRAILRIRTVRCWRIVNVRGQSRTECEHVVFFPVSRLLMVFTGSPLSIRVDVERLDLEVEVTEEVIEHRESWALRGRSSRSEDDEPW